MYSVFCISTGTHAVLDFFFLSVQGDTLIKSIPLVGLHFTCFTLLACSPLVATAQDRHQELGFDSIDCVRQLLGSNCMFQ